MPRLRAILSIRLQNWRGFSLVELAIVLLIAGLLVAGAFSLVNNMQQQRTDQATANQMRTVVTALERFLVDNQGALIQNNAGTLGAATPFPEPLSSLSVGVNGNAQTYFNRNYLPGGLAFSLANYTIGIANLGPITSTGNTNAASNLRGLVIYNPPNNLNDGRLSRIAALIGPQGGMIANGVLGSGLTGLPVTGVYGAWSVTTRDYAITSATGGMIAAYTATVDSQINTNLLSRINTGNPEANTMEAPLTMNNASNQAMVGNDILINPNAPPTNPAGTTANSILNMGGSAYLVSDAVLNGACYTGPNLGNYAANLYTTDGTTSPTLTWVAQYKLADPRLENMVVYGSASPIISLVNNPGATTTTFNPNATPTLLQCQYLPKGGAGGSCSSACWSWQPAIVPTPPIRTWHTLTSFSLETVINNPSSTNEMEVRIYFDQIANPGCRLVTSTVTGGCGSGGPPEPAGAGGANCPEMDGMNIGSAAISFGLSATVPPSGSYLLHNGPSGSCTPTGWYELY